MNFLLNVADVKLAWHAHIFGHEKRMADRFSSKVGSEPASHCWPAQWRRLAKSCARIYVKEKMLERLLLADSVDKVCRTITELRDVIADCIDQFTLDECKNYFANEKALQNRGRF